MTGTKAVIHRRKKWAVFVICTICSILPFFMALILAWEGSTVSMAAAWVLAVLIAVVDVCLFYRSFKYWLRADAETASNRASKAAFSSACILQEEKRDAMIRETYERLENPLAAGMVPYDVHHYIGGVCKELKNLISQVTGVSRERLSVEYIYRYCYESVSLEQARWKWIVGREMTDTKDLNQCVQEPGSIYYHILHHHAGIVFANEKESLVDQNNPGDSYYRFSGRDELHQKKGSLLSVRIMFSDCEKQYVDSILTISSFGELFADKGGEEQMMNLLVEEILPYYQRCLEMELGYLYLNHCRAMAGDVPAAPKKTGLPRLPEQEVKWEPEPLLKPAAEEERKPRQEGLETDVSENAAQPMLPETAELPFEEPEALEEEGESSVIEEIGPSEKEEGPSAEEGRGPLQEEAEPLEEEPSKEEEEPSKEGEKSLDEKEGTSGEKGSLDEPEAQGEEAPRPRRRRRKRGRRHSSGDTQMETNHYVAFGGGNV